ncbi:MAG: low molecular weight phosphotyrosine protein phosphatase [Flavobacteriaceae bacterium]|nr:low molecular weight phosphotyrosine protein phosphatase [Flavobacteriaceae bacterium]
MTRVLMVCLGNICRSPLAEGILRSKLPSPDYFIDSAGTGNYHVGSPPDPRSIEVARKHNLDISYQRARQFSIQDFDKFDHIFVMDRSNFQNVVKQARHDNDIAKVKKILDFLDDEQLIDVPDPYHDNDEGFEQVFQLLDSACLVVSKSI